MSDDIKYGYLYRNGSAKIKARFSIKLFPFPVKYLCHLHPLSRSDLKKSATLFYYECAVMIGTNED